MKSWWQYFLSRFKYSGLQRDIILSTAHQSFKMMADMSSCFRLCLTLYTWESTGTVIRKKSCDFLSAFTCLFGCFFLLQQEAESMSRENSVVHLVGVSLSGCQCWWRHADGDRKAGSEGGKKVVSQTMKHWKNTLKYKASLKTTEREGWERDEEGGGWVFSMAQLTVCCDHLLLEALAAGASQFGLNKKRVTFRQSGAC